MKKINQFWNWYNTMQEPWRMIFAVFILCSPLHIGALTGHYLLGVCVMLPILFSKITSIG